MVKKVLLGLLALILLVAVGGYLYYRFVIYQPPAISAQDRQAITLMPLPASLKLSGGMFNIQSSFNIHGTGINNPRVAAAIDRFKGRLRQITGVSFESDAAGPGMTIQCLDSGASVQRVREDESYQLTISKNNVALTANSVMGVLRGLETLIQLTQRDGEQWVWPASTISDQPRFPWRGLLIDVCRHWMPKEVILRNLDAMATVKLNVLHLHLSDDQGFRLESKVFPKLQEMGSDGKYYTQADMKEIIDFAAARGIRILPEFDLPGHSVSWFVGYPELATHEVHFDLKEVEKGWGCGPMDPTKEEVYQFLDQFIGEMATVFPDPYIHMGGDEVDPSAWNKSDRIQQFMKEKGFKDAHDLQAYFNKRVHELLAKHGKEMVGWEEILHPDLGKNIVVQSWQNQRSLFEAVQRGGNAILSAGYYLDYKLHAGKYYSVDPDVLPGALDIEPDTSHWKMFDIVIEAPGNNVKSQLVLFDKDPKSVNGFFAMMEQRNSFKGGIYLNDAIKCSFTTSFGDLKFSGNTMADSLSGKISLGLLDFKVTGHRTGGSDRPGTKLPTIEVIKPLTEEEKSRIMGGESAMWSEVVSSETIDSRIWPSAAAIAEKLWTPSELTMDTDDMYRRLQSRSDALTTLGLTHTSYYTKMLERMSDGTSLEALTTLVDVLEEVKYLGRFAVIFNGPPKYLPDMPLDNVADVAHPESLVARQFNQWVSEYVADAGHQKNREQILQFLQKWYGNHEQLLPLIQVSEKVKAVEKLSATLSTVAGMALKKLEGSELDVQAQSDLVGMLDYLDAGEQGVLVAVTPGLRELLLQ